MSKPPALRSLEQQLHMVVRGQTEQSNREILENHVLKWKQVKKPIAAMEQADTTAPGWNFKKMFEDRLLAEIGSHQRRLGRMATGKNRKYIRLARIIENGGSVVDTKLSDLKEVRAFVAEKLQGYRAQLHRIDMIIEVAEEWGVEVITNEVIDEADSRIAVVAT